jgi:hypothetical protein
LDFPIQIENPIKRLKAVEEDLRKLKTSTVPLSNFAAQPFLGGLFSWMVDPLVRFTLSKSTGIISSFPGPRKQISWNEYPLIDSYFSAGHDNPVIGKLNWLKS